MCSAIQFYYLEVSETNDNKLKYKIQKYIKKKTKKTNKNKMISFSFVA